MAPQELSVLKSIARDIRVVRRLTYDGVMDVFRSSPDIDDVRQANILDSHLKINLTEQAQLPASLNKTAATLGKTDDLKVAMAGNGVMLVSLQPNNAKPVYELANRVSQFIGNDATSRCLSSVYILEDENLSDSGNRRASPKEARLTVRNLEEVVDFMIAKHDLSPQQTSDYCLNINNGNFTLGPEHLASFDTIPWLQTKATTATIAQFSAASHKSIEEGHAQHYHNLLAAGAYAQTIKDPSQLWILMECLVSHSLDGDNLADSHLKACMLGSLLYKYPSLLTQATKNKLTQTIKAAIDANVQNDYREHAEQYLAQYESSEHKSIDITLRCIKRIRAPWNGMKNLMEHARLHSVMPALALEPSPQLEDLSDHQLETIAEEPSPNGSPAH